jgi:hypothetical protein
MATVPKQLDSLPLAYRLRAVAELVRVGMVLDDPSVLIEAAREVEELEDYREAFLLSLGDELRRSGPVLSGDEGEDHEF